jgi:hypothetical protein
MRGIRPCSLEALKYSIGKRGTLVFEPAPRLKDPWIVLQGHEDQVCDPKVVDAFAAQTANSKVVICPQWVTASGTGCRSFAPRIASSRSMPSRLSSSSPNSATYL